MNLIFLVFVTLFSFATSIASVGSLPADIDAETVSESVLQDCLNDGNDCESDESIVVAGSAVQSLLNQMQRSPRARQRVRVERSKYIHSGNRLKIRGEEVPSRRTGKIECRSGRVRASIGSLGQRVLKCR